MVFFLDANENIYARYGGRDATGPDSRQSLAGLHYTMSAVLNAHQQPDTQQFAVKPTQEFFIDELGGRRGGCRHCHQVKETLNHEMVELGLWDSSMAFRFPLPDNLGMKLEVDRCDVVEEIVAESPADKAGLKPGDQLKRLAETQIYSLGDAQFALDKARQTGNLAVEWVRNGKAMSGQLALPKDWKRSDISWRASMQHLVASSRLDGENLSKAQKAALGLQPKQLAFRQEENLSDQAASAGIRSGDIVYAINGQYMETNSTGLHFYVESQFIRQETVNVNVIRDGKKLVVPMVLK